MMSFWRFRVFASCREPHHVMLGVGQPCTLQESLTSMPVHTAWARSGTEKSGHFRLRSSMYFMCTQAFFCACGRKKRWSQNEQMKFKVIGYRNLTSLRRVERSTRSRTTCWFLITPISSFSASLPNRVHWSLSLSSSLLMVSLRASLGSRVRFGYVNSVRMHCWMNYNKYAMCRLRITQVMENSVWSGWGLPSSCHSCHHISSRKQ